jgi:hypothetical protein
MDSSSIPNSAAPVQQTSPEEDATLLAIEALEAQSVDPNPEPLIRDPRDMVAPRTIPTPPVVPKSVQVIEPVIPPTAPALAPIAVPEPVTPIELTPEPIPEPAPIVETAPAPVTPEPVVPEKPKKPATTAEEMADELAHAPATSPFQFFLHQKPPRTPFIILGVVVLLIGAGVAIYFVGL